MRVNGEGALGLLRPQNQRVSAKVRLEVGGLFDSDGVAAPQLPTGEERGYFVSPPQGGWGSTDKEARSTPHLKTPLL